MLQLDPTTPAAALPASQRIPASASGDGTPGAAGTFGNLLALLSGHHDGGTKAQTVPGRSRGPQNLDSTMPIAFGLAVTPAKAGGTAKDGVRTLPDAAVAVSASDAHTADEKALADNLTWLLSLAAAPKTAAQVPAPAIGPGGPAAEGPTCAPASSVADEGPAQAGPHGRGPTSSSVGSGFNRTVAASAVAAAVDNTSAAAATIAATLGASNDASESEPVPEAGARQIASRAIVADTASAGDASRKAVAPPVLAPGFVPIAASESRPGDDRGSTKREDRGSDERIIEGALPKPGPLTPAIGPAFQLPVEVRAEAAGHQLLAAEAAAPARADVLADAELPRQIVQAIRLQWADGVGTARITLQPEYLGELSIAIRVEHGAVTASLESNTASVREWIDGNQPMLRQALAEHGLHLDKLTVAEEQPQPDWSGNEDPKQKHQEEEARRAQRARRRNDADAPAFEMVA